MTGGPHGGPRGDRSSADSAPFAHPSERLFARVLDFYGIRWEYEARTFDLGEGPSGRSEAFTPDFYLPEFDSYVEITTMAQRLVTRKHRKLRRLGERYPDVRCKILHQRDIVRLATKHGLDVPREADAS